MRLLLLGGTVFLGRAVARHALDAGHEVTCLARGSSGTSVDGARFVTADRDSDDAFAALGDEQFDALVDVGRKPSHARKAVAALADRVGHATFVSSASVYADNATPGQGVDAPLLPPAPSEVDDPSGEAYGPCKVSCELAYTEGFGADRAFLCRAGLIVGPEDPSGRFGYWVRRIARGGEILAPGSRDDAVQLVDVRDLAAWIVTAAEQRLAGPYNGTGAPMTREAMLTGIDPAATLTWVPQEFLVERGVQPWDGARSLPLWLPLPEYAGFLTRDVEPSLATGLRTRPIGDSARDTLEWLERTPEGDSKLTAADEAEVLSAWHAKQGRT
jgi:nucleoside-diphosphate-sugar epimerase